MNKMIFAGAAVAIAALTAPAHAVTPVTLTQGADGSFTGGFETTVSTPGPFSLDYSFNLPVDGLTTAGVFTIRSSDITDIDFTSIVLNNQTLFNTSPTPDVFEFAGIVSQATQAGPQLFTVNGTSGGNGTFTGVINFVPNAVPEPAAWALMIGGFGMVGGTMRRSRQKVGVTFA